MPLLQCKHNRVVSSSYCPSLYKKLELLDHSKNRNIWILDTAGASRKNAQKGLLAHWDFSFLNLMFSRLSRIIVNILMNGSSLPDASRAGECKKLKFYTWAQWLGLISWKDDKRRKSDSLSSCNFRSNWVPKRNILLKFCAQIENWYFLPKT